MVVLIFDNSTGVLKHDRMKGYEINSGINVLMHCQECRSSLTTIDHNICMNSTITTKITVKHQLSNTEHVMTFSSRLSLTAVSGVL